MSAVKASPVALERLKRDQKRLLRAAILALAIVGLGCAAAFGGDYFYSAREAAKQRIASERSGLSGRIAQLASDAKEADSAIKLYGLLARANGLPETAIVDFSLDRDLLTARLTELRARHHLQDVQLNAQAPQPAVGGRAAPQGSKEIDSQVELTVKAWSDVHIADFMRDLTVGLPGFVDIQEFSMVRDGEITSESLLAAAQSSRLALVTARIKFVWRGLQAPEKPPAAPSMQGVPQASLGDDRTKAGGA